MDWVHYLLIALPAGSFAVGRGLVRRARRELLSSQSARLSESSRILRAFLILAMILVWVASLFHVMLGCAVLLSYVVGEAIWVHRDLKMGGVRPALIRRMVLGSTLMSISWLLLIYLLPVLFPALAPGGPRWQAGQV